uniref:cytochrome c heme attachment protein n=1 Tax=Eremogone bryophylla TaxID=645222 RepID=UPI0022FD52EA|nr:cytochrome c heme attachment protein [Eremogone bryophylla]YP_011014186.1 cytochrome c heme attachment protein [Arenaria roborowskii]YP_011014350.1 cytochrome c heme attachment protein [Eremogone kansuensis]WAM61250.1 cytochrome c heme attachment protein [Eremogone bryophylla]WQA10592.1 cytochrome c heme attachment protein [Arenaria roborowskii]WQA10756.1 cytochrome c heme attachment protein [Eremogone kansuensis]
MIFSTLEHILNHISFSTVSIVITLHLITLLVTKKVRLYNSLEKGMIVTFLCITGLLVTHWVYWKHFPLSDLYESLIFLSWSFYIINMIPYLKKNNLSAITTPSAILTQGFTTSALLKEMHQPSILIPALQSHWLMMHVSMMVLGYAALLGGSLLSVALLIVVSQSKIQHMNEKGYLFENFSLFSVKSVKNYYRSQFIEQLDHWSYRIISLGFILLTIGILSGAVWANEAWGSYWNWDPKETWAFITWTVFAIYLHIRTNKKFRGANSAVVAFIGFLIIWICYFGVNLLGIGLHSYGSFTLTLN